MINTHELTAVKKMAAHRVRRVMTREGRILQNTAFIRCGYGLRREEFDEVIQDLHAQGFLTVELTIRGVNRLILVKEGSL